MYETIITYSEITGNVLLDIVGESFEYEENGVTDTLTISNIAFIHSPNIKIYL